MVAGIFSTGQCGGNPQDQDQQRTPVPLAKVGSEVVDYNELRDIADRNIQQYSAGEAGLDPAVEGQIYGDVAQTLVSRALIQQIAKERSLSVDDSELKKDFEAKMEGQILQFKFQMIQQKLIKPDATEAEFAAAFKNANGRDLSEVKSQTLAEFEKNLQDPSKRSEAAFELLAKKVQESYKAKIVLSDADLKKGFDTYTTKRIIAYSTGANESEARAKVEKALAEVKAGTPFETVMNRTTEDPEPAKGKPKSESTIDLQYSVLTYDPTLEPILKLKVGEVSGILPTSSGPAIYKLIKIQNKLPAEFDKQKEALRASRIGDMAVRAASDDIRKRVGEVKFDSAMAKSLVDWRMASTDPGLRIDRSKLKSKLKEIFNGIKELDDPKFDPRAIQLARYAIFKAYYDEVDAAEKKSLDAERMELLKVALDSAPHIESFHELAKLALAAKDGPTAFDALKNAIDINAGATDLAVTRFKAQQALVVQFNGSGLAKADQSKQLAESLDRWKSDLFEDIKLAAESNADYTDLGENERKTQIEKVERFVKLGYLAPDQAAELRKLIDKWKEGVFGDLKLQIEGNTDYTDFGQSTFSDLNARIEKYGASGYISPAQKIELQGLQAKWRDEKKKFDAEQAKNAPNPDPAKKPDAPKSTTGSSSDLLKGGTAGN